MIDKEGRVIYIGKAKNLKKRVNQYFQKSKTVSTRTQKLIENITDIRYTVVDTELEALILELNLIKELHPKYNILLKDDKNYVYIKITNEDFPRVQIVRKIDDKKATYFGPKTAKHKVEKTFKTLKKVLPFRHCSLDIEAVSPTETKVTRKTIKYPCLDHYIKRCAAPCISGCTKEEYAEVINNVKRFLEGHHEEIIKNLHKKMAELAKSKDFEKAAKLRDRIKNVEEIIERQSLSDPNQTDKDIFNYVLEGEKAFFNLFQVRDGKLINQENFKLQAKSVDEKDENALKELLESFLTQYYEKTTNIPKEILIPHDPSNKKQFEKFIAEEKGQKVHLLVPQRGKKNKLLGLSLKNAKVFAERNKTSWEDEKPEVLKELKSILKLKDTPKRIECYDISHLAGAYTTGAMIVFENGRPSTSDYRRFKIKSAKESDDYAALGEVLTRRFSKFAEIKDDYKIKKIPKKSAYAIKKKDKVIGTIEEKISNGNHLLTSLQIDPKERGNKLGQRLILYAINKSKAKRIYINCKEELSQYYEQIGFQRIKKTPKGFEKHRESEAWFAYDKKSKKDSSFESKPSLIIIDGGKGQLSTALKTLKKFGLSIPVISIAKKEEEIFIPGKPTALKLDKTNPVLNLIKHSRDEAHRFALSYNKKLREKTFT